MSKPQRIQKLIKVDLDDLIEGNLESLNDIANDQLAPGKILADINYKVVGCVYDTIQIEVDAEVHEI